VIDVQPGDVCVVYDSTFPAWWIRFGAWIERKPHHWDHILIISHKDKMGTWWAIEAHPGKVGWTSGKDLQRYLTSPKTLTNVDQPKTDGQRDEIVNVAKGLFGTPYDWTAIVADGMDAIGWKSWVHGFGGDVPTHLVCSSLVTWVYQKCGLKCPNGNIRTVTPADWAYFILNRLWVGWEDRTD
jgi:hypothetical protein